MNPQPDSDSQSPNASRRQFLTLGGLAAAGSALTLRADAPLTPSTDDAHGYVNYLQATGQAVQPEGKFQPTHPDILGPFWAGGAPFRGKVTPPRAPGELLVVRGRIWSHVTKRPIASAVLDVWQADHKGEYDFQNHQRPDKRAVLPEARQFSGGAPEQGGIGDNKVRNFAVVFDSTITTSDDTLAEFTDGNKR